MRDRLTGYVLREKLSALSETFVTAWSEWVPKCFDGKVVIGTGDNGDVSSGSVPNLGAITE